MRVFCTHKGCASVADTVVKMTRPDPDAPNASIKLVRNECVCSEHARDFLHHAPFGAAVTMFPYPNEAVLSEEGDHDEPFEPDPEVAIRKAAAIIGLAAWR